MNNHSFEDSRVRLRFSSARFAKQETAQAIHLRFERMVAEYGDRIAIKTRSSKLTYENLNRFANRISKAVAAKCSEETARIALLFSHDASAMAAIIGVLKSGKIYIPIDPSFPSARIHFMVENAQVSLIIANNGTIEKARIIAGGRIPVLNVDEIEKSISDENPHNPVSPDSFAYILYTSGSTGQPKGVIHTHRNLMHQIYSYTNHIGITDSDRLSLIPSYGVGAAHVDIYAALLNGAALYPFNVKEEGVQQLIDWLVTEQITVYHSVPTLFRHITHYLTQETSFQKLRVINLGGERVGIKDIELFKTYFARNTIFVNSLACTEAGVFAQYFADHDSELRGNRVPSGYPTEDMEIALLDEQSDGSSGDRIGEITIKSRYLSPGYWQNPNMTKAAFKLLPDRKGSLLYCTGDIGRMRRDGLLEYIGRKDFQIKIRGFRVELEEVEAVLGQHPCVRESAVIAMEDDAENTRIVAYTVFNQGSAVSTDELRSFLKEKLPDYMIPSAFVVLGALPLTPNGKVDRKALPIPDHLMPGRTKTFVAPRNTLEYQLTMIWEKVLGIQPIGVTDNFFEMGGHSLLAARLASEINKITRNKLPIMTILQLPTIEQLAEMLTKGGCSVQMSSLVPIQPCGSRMPFFWVHGQQSDSLLPRYLDADQPLYGLIHQGLDGKVPYTTVEEITSHYLKEIRTFQPEGPYLLGGYCFGGIIALEMARNLLQQGEEVPLLFLVDPPRKCFPLTTLPNTSVPKNYSFCSRVVYHSRKLVLMPLGYKIAYAFQKLPYAFNLIRERIMRKVEPKIKMAICNVYRYFGRQLPLSLMSFYLIAIYRKAIGNYTPKLYPGGLIICHSDEVSYGSRSDMSRLAAEGVKVYKVPGSGHIDIIQEPYVKIWAKHLKICLHEIQAVKRVEKI